MDFLTAPLASIVQFINTIILNLFSILPDSPFKTLLKFSDEYELLGILNYFIPFDVAFELLAAWLAAVSAYYTYCFIMGTLTVKNPFLDKIIGFFL